MSGYEYFDAVLRSKGLKASDVSRATGIRSGVFSDWKAGRYTPKHDKLCKIADYLGVDVEMFDGVPNTGPQNDSQWYITEETAKIAQEIFEDPNKRALFYAARDSRPEDLKMAADMLERFKETNPDG